ncbi:MAG: hypothetical protein LUQ07_00220 [Methanospirillum sp.]|nr:hypothetical protein [Methanospirillum sp.]
MKTPLSYPGSARELVPGMVADIRALEKIGSREAIDIVVYFEEDLAYNSTYADDIRKFGDDPEHERPFISLAVFLSFQRGMNPLFDEALVQIPLGITIIRQETIGNVLKIIGLLPFLDEMDMT